MRREQAICIDNMAACCLGHASFASVSSAVTAASSALTRHGVKPKPESSTFLPEQKKQKEVFGDEASAQRTVSEDARSWDAAGGAPMLKVRCKTNRSSYAMFWERYKCILSCIFQSVTANSQNYSTVQTSYRWFL